jgi:serine/threonine protein kinase
VHDFDRDAGNVYMVMEFLSGRSLEQVLREDGRGGIPLGPAMDIIKCLGAALSYAHEQDIVHCDFKPSNAFLSSDGKVKVLDFGIARAAPSLLEKGDATLFDAGQLGAISPAYASLEMLQRETPDVRDDVYALACVIYELLTGVHPYQRIDAIKAYQTGLQPRPIRKLSRAQWRALKQGLEFQRTARSPNIDALVRPLVTPPSRAMLWIGVAAACLVTVVVAAGLVWKWSDVRRVAAEIHIPFKTHTAEPLQAQPSASASAASPAPTASDAFPSAPSATVDANVPVSPQSGDSESISRELEATLSSPEPTQEWAARLHNLLLQYGPADARARHTGQVAVQVFVAAAADARARKEFDRAAALLATARSFDEHAPELVSESVALERDRAVKADPQAKVDPVAKADPVALEQKRAGAEILKEQFETQAAAGDVVEASATAVSLSRALPGSNYVTRDVPQMLAASYLHRAKTEFAGGKVNESLQTLAESRKKFGRSADLKDLEERYVRAADVYDRLGSAVVLSVPDTMRMIEDLKSTEGGEFEIAAQMLAQTLADRIADQRAAGRGAVADKLLEAGKQIFPNLHGILTRGTAGVLSNTPIEVKEN